MKDSDLIFGLMASFGKEAYTFDDLRHLTAPFHVSVPSLRTNLSRMSAAQMIRISRSGRNALYQFGAKGTRIKDNIVHSFRPLDWDDWDGTYWGMTFSVPEAHGESRHYIRKKLTKYRFACLNPGLWVRPAHPAERIPETFDSLLSTGYCRLIRFTNHREFTPAQADALWNLGAVNQRFSAGLALMDAREQKLASLPPALALVERMTVGDAIVDTLFGDPLLPPAFLPSGWEGGTIRERFADFDRLAMRQSKPYWNKIFLKEDMA